MSVFGQGFEGEGQIGPHQHETAGALYGHVEHLADEEEQLLAIAEHERSEQHHARLREIEAVLDRIWHRLHQRHQKRGGKPAA